MKSTSAAIVVIGVLGALLAGCGKEERKPLATAPPESSTGQATVPAAPREARGEGKNGRAPLSATLVLAPANPDAQSGVRASLAGLPPGVAVQWEKVRWFINGAEFPGEQERLPGGMIRRGDRVQASAMLVLNGEKVTLMSREEPVRNCLPEVLTAQLSDDAPKTGQELRVLATGRDADGDLVSFRCRWFLNDKEMEGQTANALSLVKVPKGSWVYAEVQAFDGIDLGSKRFTSKVRVVNSPPVVEQVSITRGEGGHFIANIRVRDADGDPVTIRAKTLPGGVTLSGTALFWEESAIPQGKEAPVVLLLSDGDGGDVEYSFRLTSSQK